MMATAAHLMDTRPATFGPITDHQHAGSTVPSLPLTALTTESLPPVVNLAAAPEWSRYVQCRLQQYVRR